MSRLVAVLGALVASLVVSFGVTTAANATPAPSIAIGDPCSGSDLLSAALACVGGVVTSVTGPATTSPTPVPCPAGQVFDRDRCVDRGNFGGGFRGRDHFDGHVIVLDGGGNLDACDGSDSYTVFLDRHSAYRDRLTRDFGTGSGWWDNLHNSCTGSTTQTTVNGNCTTVTTLYDNYQGSVNRWNDLANRFRGGSLSDVQRRELDQAYRDRVGYARDFAAQRPSVNTVCNVPASTNNITVAPPPVSYAAPSSGQVAQVPSGSVNTGGWTAGFTLAHNRVR